MNLETYLLLDKRVDEAEGDGIMARWEFGRELLRERVGKQLPAGRLDEVAGAIGKSRSEVSHRLRFAEDYPTEDEVRNAITNFGSWYAIVNKSTAHVSHNSGENEWYTPLAYISAACDVMGRIDLDPASSTTANELIEAEHIFTAEDDGLAHDWWGRVWMNPPYAQPLIAQFCQKLVEEYEGGNVIQACVLVNNATETTWWQLLHDSASAVAFPKGRVKFWHPNRNSATPLQGQTVLYFGSEDLAFRSAFAQFGGVR